MSETQTQTQVNSESKPKTVRKRKRANKAEEKGKDKVEVIDVEGQDKKVGEEEEVKKVKKPKKAIKDGEPAPIKNIGKFPKARVQQRTPYSKPKESCCKEPKMDKAVIHNIMTLDKDWIHKDEVTNQRKDAFNIGMVFGGLVGVSSILILEKLLEQPSTIPTAARTL